MAWGVIRCQIGDDRGAQVADPLSRAGRPPCAGGAGRALRTAGAGSRASVRVHRRTVQRPASSRERDRGTDRVLPDARLASSRTAPKRSSVRNASQEWQAFRGGPSSCSASPQYPFASVCFAREIRPFSVTTSARCAAAGREQVGRRVPRRGRARNAAHAPPRPRDARKAMPIMV